jgi:hypothetical protein
VRLYADVDAFLLKKNNDVFLSMRCIWENLFTQCKVQIHSINCYMNQYDSQGPKEFERIHSLKQSSILSDIVRVCVSVSFISCASFIRHYEKKKHLSQGDFPYLNSTGGSPSSPSYPTPQPHAGGQEPW